MRMGASAAALSTDSAWLSVSAFEGRPVRPSGISQRSGQVEKMLAARHPSPGGIAMFDLSSSWVEGSCCELATFGHSRDGKRGRRQVEYGLLTDAKGRPVAVEVFPGNTSDPEIRGPAQTGGSSCDAPAARDPWHACGEPLRARAGAAESSGSAASASRPGDPVARTSQRFSGTRWPARSRPSRGIRAICAVGCTPEPACHVAPPLGRDKTGVVTLCRSHLARGRASLRSR